MWWEEFHLFMEENKTANRKLSETGIDGLHVLFVFLQNNLLYVGVSIEECEVYSHDIQYIFAKDKYFINTYNTTIRFRKGKFKLYTLKVGLFKAFQGKHVMEIQTF